MKILHLLSQRPDSTGSGIYVQAMLRAAADRGHTNHLLAGVPADEVPDPAGFAAAACSFVGFGSDSLPLPIVGMSDVMPYPSARFRDLTNTQIENYRDRFREVLRKAVEAFTPDLIHSHHLWLLTATAREQYPELPLVTSCHGSDLRQFRQCADLRPLVQDPCRRLDGVFALSRAARRDIVELYGIDAVRVHVVGAGYNAALFRPAEPPADDRRAGPVQIVYAGKLSRAKGVPWLLRALATIEQPAWRLHVVGGGSGEERLECLDLATELGERAVVHGALPQPELAELLRRSHLFVLPSLFEGLPLVLLEALASGCRLVATALPGVQEVLGDLDEHYLSLVPLPALRGVDTLAPGADAAFTANIAAALASQLRCAEQQPVVDLDPITDRLDTYTWTRVFSRIETVYRAVRQ